MFLKCIIGNILIMYQSKDNHSIPMTSFSSGKGVAVTEDVYYYTDQIVNYIFIGNPSDANVVLVDAGMPNSGEEVIESFEKRFGKGAKPKAIILTHGHFDHVGSLVFLLEKWRIPVYAHPLEFPYLTGKEAYPDPDATVEGGMLAKLSFIYPHEPIDVSPLLLPLPSDGTVPHLTEWRWIHVPGHTPGQIALFREKDKFLIAADAFVTVRTDSFYKVLVDKKEINGPPRYLTTDWKKAKESVQKLQQLHPETAITGHGPFMSGKELSEGLKNLADNFDQLAVPSHGKYVKE
jgi:glyoxylase-like metal-dependent hydrolase (beta-lactamase superfamily II)